MKSSRNANPSILFSALALLLTSCITVNVNFPEGAVQKAADDYVRELYKSKQKKDGEPATPLLEKQGFNFEIIPSSYAEGEGISINTPRAIEIKKKQAARLSDILKYEGMGAIGESYDGMLVMKDVKPILAKVVEPLIQDENKDRAELYAEVLKANRFPDSRKIDVQRTFARSFQDASPAGTWIEKSPGQWTKK